MKNDQPHLTRVLNGSPAVLTLIPYLYMFLALIVVRRSPDRFSHEPGLVRSSWLCYGSGAVGFCMAAFGVVVSFVPSPGVDDAGNFQFKMALGVLAFLVPALFIYGWKGRRLRATGLQRVSESTEEK